MIVSPLVVLVACLINRIEFMSEVRAICNQEAQRAYAVAAIHIAGKADTDCEEARLVTFAVLPPPAQFRPHWWDIGVAPLEFQRDVGCASFVAEWGRRFCTSEHVILNVSLAPTKGIKAIGPDITIKRER